MSIYHVRLITGEELLGEWLGTTEETEEIVIKTPMSMSDAGQHGTNGLILTRYTTFDAVEVVSFKPEHVISLAPVIDEMAEYYNLSVEYTNKVARKAVMHELNEINRTLRGILHGEQNKLDFLDEISDPMALAFSHTYSSNTHH